MPNVFPKLKGWPIIEGYFDDEVTVDSVLAFHPTAEAWLRVMSSGRVLPMNFYNANPDIPTPFSKEECYTVTSNFELPLETVPRSIVPTSTYVALKKKVQEFVRSHSVQTQSMVSQVPVQHDQLHIGAEVDSVSAHTVEKKYEKLTAFTQMFLYTAKV